MRKSIGITEEGRHRGTDEVRERQYGERVGGGERNEERENTQDRMRQRERRI